MRQGPADGVPAAAPGFGASVEPAQPDLAVDDKAESKTSAASSVGSARWVFTRRRNSSFSRSIALVARSVFHSRFGNW